MNFLLELGVEDIPAKYLDKLLDDLKLNLSALIDWNFEVLGTHKRVVFKFENLEDSFTLREEIKGPAKNIVFVEDKISKAGEKFLEKHQANEKDLILINEKGKEYVALVREERRATYSVILEKIEHVLSKLYLPKSMVWSGMRFIRPIRRLLALCDGQVLNVSLGDLESVKWTFFEGEKIEVKSYNQYFGLGIKLKKEDRLKEIELPLSETLLEAINTVEDPKSVLCSFDSKFLALPYKAIEKTIQINQMGIMDGNSYHVITEKVADDDLVRRGNSIVVNSKLSDAFDCMLKDKAKSIDEFVDALKSIQFRIGSMHDKQMRVFKLAQKYNLSNKIQDAAKICKFDLATAVVQEKDFADLRGYIGSEYSGNKLVFEHYLPRFKGDVMPSREGAMLSLFDKLDNIVSAALLSKLPTGAKDPQYIRRDGWAVLNIIDSFDLDVDIEDISLNLAKLYNKKLDIDQFKKFFFTRIESYFNSNLVKALPKDINILSIKEKISTLSDEKAEKIKEIYTRASMVKGREAKLVGELNEYEQELLNAVNAVNAESFKDLLNSVLAIQKPLDRFLENVIVFSKDRDEELRRVYILKKVLESATMIMDIEIYMRG